MINRRKPFKYFLFVLRRFRNLEIYFAVSRAKNNFLISKFSTKETIIKQSTSS